MSERTINDLSVLQSVTENLDSISRRNFLKLSPYIGLAFAALACSNYYGEQTTTTRVRSNSQGQDYGVTVEAGLGRTNLQLFTSEKYYFENKQPEIVKALYEFVNSGRYNVAEVQTSYSQGYLTAARANYVPEIVGRGNSLRVRLIQSSQYYWNQKDPEVKRDLDRTLRDAQNVHKVNTIFQNGYLLAAEVWYFQ